MTDSTSSNPALELKVDQSACPTEQKGSIPTKSLSKKAQELWEAIQALGCSVNNIQLQMLQGWDNDSYKAAKAELIAAGKEISQFSMGGDTSSIGEADNNIQELDNEKTKAGIRPATEEKSSVLGKSSQESDQVDHSSSELADDFVHAAMSIGSPSYEDDEKNLTIAILFIKVLSDLFEDIRQQAVESFVEKGICSLLSEEYAADKSLHEQVFFVPKVARWRQISSLSTGITEGIFKACNELENAHPSIEGALSSITHLIQPAFWGLMDADLSNLIKLTSSVEFNSPAEGVEFFAKTCDILERIYADFSQEIGDRSIEKYQPIPRSASRLLVTLLKPEKGMSIYNPNCSIGSLFLETSKYLGEQGEDSATLSFAGEETSIGRWRICKLSLFLHGINTARIRRERATPESYVNKTGVYDRILVSMLDASGSLDDIQHMIPTLKNDGMMGILMPNTTLSRTSPNGDFEKKLVSSDLIEAVISLPRELGGHLRSQTAIVIINVNKPKKLEKQILFVDASYDSSKEVLATDPPENNIRKIQACISSHMEIEDYSRIVATEEVIRNSYSLDVCRYVDASPEARQVKRLAKQYDGYSVLPLSELACGVEIVSIDGVRDTCKDTIYIGTNDANLLPGITERKNVYAYKISLDSSRVIGRYLELFLQSELGSLMRTNLIERDVVLREASLMSLAIPVPDVATQIEMAEAAERLGVLKDGIQQLENELIFSPPSASAVLDQVDGMLEAVGSLTDVDRLMSLIRQGESKQIEFKESFSLDIRNNTREKHIEHSSLKTIAAFLNSEGGFLLVGVDDEGSIVGLDQEIDRFHNASRDKFLLHFKNNVKSRIGEEFYPYINQRLVVAGGRAVLFVECKKSASGCFLDGKDFYVRTNPSTDKLEGARLISYIKNNFSF